MFIDHVVLITLHTIGVYKSRSLRVNHAIGVYRHVMLNLYRTELIPVHYGLRLYASGPGLSRIHLWKVLLYSMILLH